LEALLGRFEEDEMDPDIMTQVTLEDPIVLLLAQHRSFRVCRSRIFCPDQHCKCTKKFATVGKLATHLVRDHQAQSEAVADIIGYFIGEMLPEPIRPILTDETGGEVRKTWGHVRCHHPGCTYFSANFNGMLHHVSNVHRAAETDIDTLGWFWGTIRRIIIDDPRATIAAVLGEGTVWECGVERCGHFFLNGEFYPTALHKGSREQNNSRVEGTDETAATGMGIGRAQYPR
jgi:hypothetical protein